MIKLGHWTISEAQQRHMRSLLHLQMVQLDDAAKTHGAAIRTKHVAAACAQVRDEAELLLSSLLAVDFDNVLTIGDLTPDDIIPAKLDSAYLGEVIRSNPFAMSAIDRAFDQLHTQDVAEATVGAYTVQGHSGARIVNDPAAAPQPTRAPDGGMLWIEWRGGEKPVDGSVRVEVELTNGIRETHPADAFRWVNEHDGADIVAYRLAEVPADKRPNPVDVWAPTNSPDLCIRCQENGCALDTGLCATCTKDGLISMNFGDAVEPDTIARQMTKNEIAEVCAAFDLPPDMVEKIQASHPAAMHAAEQGHAKPKRAYTPEELSLMSADELAARGIVRVRQGGIQAHDAEMIQAGIGLSSTLDRTVTIVVEPSVSPEDEAALRAEIAEEQTLTQHRLDAFIEEMALRADMAEADAIKPLSIVPGLPGDELIEARGKHYPAKRQKGGRPGTAKNGGTGYTD